MELLLIAGILGIVSGIVTPSILSIRHQAAMEDVMRNVVGIKNAPSIDSVTHAERILMREPTLDTIRDLELKYSLCDANHGYAVARATKALQNATDFETKTALDAIRALENPHTAQQELSQAKNLPTCANAKEQLDIVIETAKAYKIISADSRFEMR